MDREYDGIDGIADLFGDNCSPVPRFGGRMASPLISPRRDDDEQGMDTIVFPAVPMPHDDELFAPQGHRVLVPRQPVAGPAAPAEEDTEMAEERPASVFDPPGEADERAAFASVPGMATIMPHVGDDGIPIANLARTPALMACQVAILLFTRDMDLAPVVNAGAAALLHLFHDNDELIEAGRSFTRGTTAVPIRRAGGLAQWNERQQLTHTMLRSETHRVCGDVETPLLAVLERISASRRCTPATAMQLLVAATAPMRFRAAALNMVSRGWPVGDAAVAIYHELLCGHPGAALPMLTVTATPENNTAARQLAAFDIVLGGGTRALAAELFGGAESAVCSLAVWHAENVAHCEDPQTVIQATHLGRAAFTAASADTRVFELMTTIDTGARPDILNTLFMMCSVDDFDIEWVHTATGVRQVLPTEVVFGVPIAPLGSAARQQMYPAGYVGKITTVRHTVGDLATGKFPPHVIFGTTLQNFAVATLSTYGVFCSSAFGDHARPLSMKPSVFRKHEEEGHRLALQFFSRSAVTRFQSVVRELQNAVWGGIPRGTGTASSVGTTSSCADDVANLDDVCDANGNENEDTEAFGRVVNEAATLGEALTDTVKQVRRSGYNARCGKALSWHKRRGGELIVENAPGADPDDDSDESDDETPPSPKRRCVGGKRRAKSDPSVVMFVVGAAAAPLSVRIENPIPHRTDEMPTEAHVRRVARIMRGLRHLTAVSIKRPAGDVTHLWPQSGNEFLE
jgi:hypothetical protein